MVCESQKREKKRKRKERKKKMCENDDEAMKRRCKVNEEAIEMSSGGDKEVARELILTFIDRLNNLHLPALEKAVFDGTPET